MMTITLKRAYEAAQPTDGYRILADRLWPRGIKKETFALDLWAKYNPQNEMYKIAKRNVHKFQGAKI